MNHDRPFMALYGCDCFFNGNADCTVVQWLACGAEVLGLNPSSARAFLCGVCSPRCLCGLSLGTFSHSPTTCRLGSGLIGDSKLRVNSCSCVLSECWVFGEIVSQSCWFNCNVICVHVPGGLHCIKWEVLLLLSRTLVMQNICNTRQCGLFRSHVASEVKNQHIHHSYCHPSSWV